MAKESIYNANALRQQQNVLTALSGLFPNAEQPTFITRSKYGHSHLQSTNWQALAEFLMSQYRKQQVDTEEVETEEVETEEVETEEVETEDEAFEPEDAEPIDVTHMTRDELLTFAKANGIEVKATGMNNYISYDDAFQAVQKAVGGSDGNDSGGVSDG